MKKPPTKRHLQVVLALTLLACSGLAGCSNNQEQSGSNTDNARAAVVSTHTKALQPRQKPAARLATHLQRLVRLL